MGCFGLIWAGIWRRRTRSLLAILSIANAFLLFGVLQGFNVGLARALSRTGAGHLDVASPFGVMFSGLPKAYQYQIARLAGVRKVVYSSVFVGTYQSPTQVVPALAVVPDDWFKAFPDLEASKSALTALRTTRTGALIGSGLAARYGWKAGDHIALRSISWQSRERGADWEFDVVGLYDSRQNPGRAAMMLFNHDYFDAARTAGDGLVSQFDVALDDPATAGAISREIDRMFASSPFPTLTKTQEEASREQFKSIGDVGLIVAVVVGAVLVTLILSCSAMMMQSVRERRGELATLQAVGFSARRLSALVLSETTLLSVGASVCGTVLAALLFREIGHSIGLNALPTRVIGEALALALGLALVSGVPPALWTTRQTIAESLAAR